MNHWAKMGKYFGFPKCCVRVFDKGNAASLPLRWKAGQLNGNGTGFVPCAMHAHLILNGKVQLKNLIKNRLCPHPFPEDGVESRADAQAILQQLELNPNL